MTTWDRLRTRLLELQADPHHPLRGSPNPNDDSDRPSPYHIRLAAWAAPVAEELHSAFGDDVDLTVGHLGYPAARRPAWLDNRPRPRPEVADPNLLFARLPQPISVSSGHHLRAELTIENTSPAAIVVNTNGQLTATVLDPRSHEPVATYEGAQALPLVRFDIPPGGQRVIPLLIGTASLRPEIGYAVPPGEWAFEAELDLGSGRWRTAPLPLTITDGPPPPPEAQYAPRGPNRRR